MRLHLTAPSKTFLLGEYIALQGGPTLVLTNSPCFELAVKSTQPQNPIVFENINKESPAGKFLLQHAEAFKGYHLSFHDPYQGLGGFGASSAQFLLVNILKNILKDFSLKINCNVNELLNDYYQFAWNGEGIKPSGADLIAQAQGGISYFYKPQNRLQKLAWPFASISYYLLHTGVKVATHQHLKELSSFKKNNLMDITFAGLQHLQTNNVNGFIDCINQYAQTLQQLDLVFPKTIELLKKIHTRSEVLAAKGCGALGADVILVLTESKHQEVFVQWLVEQKINLIAYGDQLSAGLQIQTEAEILL